MKSNKSLSFQKAVVFWKFTRSPSDSCEKRMCYSSRLPSALAKWLQPPTVDLQSLLKDTERELSTAKHLSVTLSLCTTSHTTSDYRLIRVIQATLGDVLLAGHVNLAKWIICKQNLSTNGLRTNALWAEDKSFTQLLNHDYQFNTMGFVTQIVRDVPTTFAVSYLLGVAVPGTDNAHMMYSNLVTALALMRHLDLLIPTIEAILEREVCIICVWGKRKGYIESCVHAQWKFGLRNIHGVIDDDIKEQVRKVYPWLRYY